MEHEPLESRLAKAAQPASPSIQSAYRGVRALVLGSSGFIGAWTVRALHACGASVIAVARDERRARAALERIGSDIRIEVSDLEEPGAVRRLIRGIEPAIVFNLAGYGVDRSECDSATMIALNARLGEQVCQAIGEQHEHEWTGLRLVHAGSAAEYGPVVGTIAETSPECPITEYGRTKLAGTRALLSSCATANVRAIVARLFTVYGPGEHSGKLLSSLIRAAKTGEPLRLTSGRQRRNFTYVQDVAEALLRLGLSATCTSGTVNVAGARAISVREFAETAATVLGFDSALLAFGALPDRDDEMWHGDVDGARFRALTAWMPSTAVAEGIRRTWEFEHA